MFEKPLGEEVWMHKFVRTRGSAEIVDFIAQDPVDVQYHDLGDFAARRTSPGFLNNMRCSYVARIERGE